MGRASQPASPGTAAFPDRDCVSRSNPTVQPQTSASHHRSKLVEARHRNRAAVLGFQGSEVVEGGDAFAEVL